MINLSQNVSYCMSLHFHVLYGSQCIKYDIKLSVGIKSQVEGRTMAQQLRVCSVLVAYLSSTLNTGPYLAAQLCL